jgi:internalin A
VENIMRRSNQIDREMPRFAWGTALVWAALFLPEPALAVETRANQSSGTKALEGQQKATAALKGLGARITHKDNDAGEAIVHFRGYRGRYDERIIDGGLEHLQAIGNLRALDLSFTQVTDAGLRHLQALPKLRFLSLGGCKNVTDAGIEYLQELPGLRGLRLTGTRVSDAGIEHLNPNIEVLSLRDTQVSDVGLARLEKLTSLRVLRLDRTKVTNAGLVHLKPFKLEELFLTGTRITDDGLKHIKQFPSMQKLFLRDTGITDAGLKCLEGLENLGWVCVTLESGRVTQAGVDKLKAALPECKIEFLSQDEQKAILALRALGAFVRQNSEVGEVVEVVLHNTTFTDAGLDNLTALKNLQILNLANTQVTDVGLEHLKGLRNLRSVTLKNTKITQAGVDKLEAALPESRITYP